MSLTVGRDLAVIIITVLIGMALMSAMPSMVRYAFGAGGADVAAMEAALGVAVGSTRVVPQCGCTIRYLGAKKINANTFAVYIQKLN